MESSPAVKFIMQHRRASIISSVVAIAIFLSLYIYYFEFQPPRDFPETAVAVVADGKSLSSVAAMLKEQNIIRSPFWLTNFVILLRHERKVVGGEYYFERPLNVYEVAKRITKGNYNIGQLKTTIPEGSNLFAVSVILKKHYPKFDDIHFLTIARSSEGYLFPDTYYFGADVRPEKVMSVMKSTFEQKIAGEEVSAVIRASDRPVKDLVIMASILEGEARQTRTRQIVAGILWERIRRGIPLQVDAAFSYINGKTSAELTLSDLKIDSPYNTYVYKGLTPTPISNPGLDSIIAAATPIKTDYLYFLTGDDGTMHYARTLDEHMENKRKYLK